MNGFKEPCWVKTQANQLITTNKLSFPFFFFLSFFFIFFIFEDQDQGVHEDEVARLTL